MKPFRKQATVWRLAGKKVPPGTLGATKEVIESRKWYGTVRGRHVPLCGDYQAAQRMLKKLEADAELKRVGLADPHGDSKATPLSAHLVDFEAHLTGKGNTPAHVAATMRRLRGAVGGCGWKSFADLSATKLEVWLNSKRGGRAAALPPEPKEYSPGEVAALLGCSRENVGKLIRTNALPAPTGEGKARRMPRETVQSLIDLSGRGTGPKTRNYYRKHLKHFGAWLVKDRRSSANPFQHVELEPTDADVRRHRRAATVEELAKLVTTARASRRVYRGLTGPDRAVLYAVAFTTGFRASALASLTPSHFALDADPPTVSLAARNNKSRKPKVNPLPKDAAAALVEYLAGRPGPEPIWPGNWVATAADMLRADLADAGIGYIAVEAGERSFLDFHAVGRHSCLTHAARAGVPLSVIQKLAGHASPVTTARYVHTSDPEVLDAVRRLPAIAVEPSPVCTQFARALCKSGQPEAVEDNRTPPNGQVDVTTELPNPQGFVNSIQPKSIADNNGPARIRTENQGIMSPLL
jgi:integrase/recombinase XerC